MKIITRRILMENYDLDPNLTSFFSDLEWLTYQDASHDLLVALHPPYSLVLWNADTGTKLWKKSYTEPLMAFSFDPFNSKNVACECLLWFVQGNVNVFMWSFCHTLYETGIYTMVPYLIHSCVDWWTYVH